MFVGKSPGVVLGGNGGLMLSAGLGKLIGLLLLRSFELCQGEFTEL